MSIKSFLHILSGDDRSIINQCSSQTQNKFALIGGFVALAIILSFISVTGAFMHFFDFMFFDILIGVFFAFLIANLYLLLLYTLSKNLLPHKESKGAKWVSFVLRVLFISIFAVIVSKPIELVFFNEKLEADIELYKETHYKVSASIIESMYLQPLKDLEFAKNMGDVDADLKILQKNEEKSTALLNLEDKIAHTDFYIQKIRILNYRYPETWFVTFLVILVFLTPIFIKYFFAAQMEFYQMKKEIETRIVLDEYASFKNRYKSIWKNFIEEVSMKPVEYRYARINLVLAEIKDKHCEFEVDYIDPPFNTVRKIDERNFLAQSSLKEELYDVGI